MKLRVEGPSVAIHPDRRRDQVMADLVEVGLVYVDTAGKPPAVCWGTAGAVPPFFSSHAPLMRMLHRKTEFPSVPLR